MKRRRFLKHIGLAGPVYAFMGSRPYLSAFNAIRQPYQTEWQADIVIVGGGVGGCAAALAAARNGLRVILTEETDWIGGQLTQQGVPPDEHPWIEQFGATRSYQAFRTAIRDYYRDWYPLQGHTGRQQYLNPGQCSVSAICHEPRVALAVFEGMLAPYVSSGRLRILLETVPVSASVTGDRIESVRVKQMPRGEVIDLTAPYFLDATELGDLLPLAETEYVTGAESQDQTDEPHAPAMTQPENIQAMTWCFAVDYVDGENFTIEKPSVYDFWRHYIPDVTPPWPGRLLDLTYSHPVTLEPRTAAFDPRPGAESEAFNLWNYRRLADPDAFQPGVYQSGISLINWPQNDYILGHLIDVEEDIAGLVRDGAKQLSYALMYWLQTEAPRPDGGTGWPGLRLRGDLLGTDHGLAKRPYIRESRRIKAAFTVKEQHVGLEARMETTGLDVGEVTAAHFDDSVGIGSYRIDLHPSTGGDNYIDISSLPFEIPMGALIPERVENLLPACKNLGVTHITNGCYRLHPVEWNIGEAAGLAAVYCLQNNHPPRYVYENQTHLEDFQRLLERQGIDIRWPQAARTPR